MPFAHVLFICVPSQCTNNNYASILSLEDKKTNIKQRKGKGKGLSVQNKEQKT